MTTPRLLVEAPPITPYEYGLASVAQPASTDDDHWQLGVEYESIGAYLASVTAAACGGAVTKTLPGTVATTKGMPFGIIAGVDCAAVGYDEPYLISRAQAILKLGWQHAAETALWNGGGVANAAPVLNSTGTATTVGTGLSMTAAVSALEAYLGSNYFGVGVIHAPRAIAAYADRNRQVTERAGQLQTTLGTGWCFGGGYDGTGPGNTTPPANTIWMYATGLVTVRRGDPRVAGGLPAAFNRSTNHQMLYAEQPALLTVDGPIAAVSVDLTK